MACIREAASMRDPRGDHRFHDKLPTASQPVNDDDRAKHCLSMIVNQATGAPVHKDEVHAALSPPTEKAGP